MLTECCNISSNLLELSGIDGLPDDSNQDDGRNAAHDGEVLRITLCCRLVVFSSPEGVGFVGL
jgi:hypothetical protein